MLSLRLAAKTSALVQIRTSTLFITILLVIYLLHNILIRIRIDFLPKKLIVNNLLCKNNLSGAN
jgi:hypothetical protein